MIQSILPRLRIAFILIIAFVISGFIMKYASSSPQGEAPYLEVKNIASDFSRSISGAKSGVIATFQSIHIPSFTSPFLSSSTIQPQEEEIIIPTEPPYEGWTIGATVTPQPTLLPSLSISPSLIPPTTKPLPTVPRATSTPKPTSKPKPSPTPEFAPVTSDQRPGSSLEEVFKEVSKRMCIPVALLKATQQQESGSRYRNFAASKFSLANRYNWWNEQGVTETDYFNGVAYSAQSGKAPADSKFPGAQIATAIQPNAYDQQIMGPEQISAQEEEVSRKNTIKILPKNIDRRVLFDNLIIYTSITINRAGSSPHSNCDDWPEETVRLVAQKHFGACEYGSGKNYCTEVWNLYKSFK